MSRESRYWFPAKTYGWGWGPPSSWQGWLVIAGYVALVCATVLSFKVYHLFSLGQHVGIVILLTLALTLICWLKGEPPRWRWGKD